MNKYLVEQLEAELRHYRARERHFASVLKVADGGQYRADWDARLQDLVNKHRHLSAQIDQLAKFIMAEVKGEPSQSEGAVECAIRLLKDRNRLLRADARRKAATRAARR